MHKDIVASGLPLDASFTRHAEAVLAEVRDAVGSGVDVMVDFHDRTWPE